MNKLVIVLHIIILIIIYSYYNVVVIKGIVNKEILNNNYEKCCLELVQTYINSGGKPSLISTIDFISCKNLLNRLQQDKYSYYGLFNELTIEEIFEYILSITLIRYIYNFIKYLNIQFSEILYICNGLELFLQHYFIILRSILQAVELIYLEGVSSYINNTQLVAKNIELIGILFAYRIVYQLLNFINTIIYTLYSISLLLVNSTNKIYNIVTNKRLYRNHYVVKRIKK